MKFLKILSACSLLAFLALLAGCHSYHVEATVENQTGGEIRLLEVDYPSASFGADSLASGAAFHYRFQIRGSGEISVHYTAPDGHPVEIKGPVLSERQEGRLDITLQPSGKALFLPDLTAKR